MKFGDGRTAIAPFKTGRQAISEVSTGSHGQSSHSHSQVEINAADQKTLLMPPQVASYGRGGRRGLSISDLHIFDSLRWKTIRLSKIRVNSSKGNIMTAPKPILPYTGPC